ncbi:putative remorin [Tanacetum coccineum]
MGEGEQKRVVFRKTLPSKWDDAERWITSPVSGSGSGVSNKNLGGPPQRRPKSKNEKIDENNVSYDVSRRDMATQMSPVESPESSPKGRTMLSTSPLLIASAMDHRSHHSAGVEVRDVQVDKRVTMSKQPKRHARRMERNRSTEIKELSLTWNPTEEAMESSKLQKEEARITAWENLQNAKAEASIRKLEMKLEKKKLASMDKIMNKLRIAQAKAQEMRQGMSAIKSKDPTDEETSNKVDSYGTACSSL